MAKKKVITAPEAQIPRADLNEAVAILSEACAVLQSQLQSFDSNVGYGAHRLLAAGKEHLKRELRKATSDDLEEVSVELACGLDVLGAYLASAEADDQRAVASWGAHRLAAFAKAIVDDRSDSVSTTAAKEYGHV